MNSKKNNNDEFSSNNKNKKIEQIKLKYEFKYKFLFFLSIALNSRHIYIKSSLEFFTNKFLNKSTSVPYFFFFFVIISCTTSPACFSVLIKQVLSLGVTKIHCKKEIKSLNAFLIIWVKQLCDSKKEINPFIIELLINFSKKLISIHR